MKQILIIAYFFFWCLPAIFSQQTVVSYNCDSIDNSAFEPHLAGELLQTFPHTSGSQYSYDWDDADIILKSGEIVYNKKIRYNGYLNEMIWLTAIDFKSVKLDKPYIKEIYFKNLHLLCRQLNVAGNQDSATIFAEVLYESKIKFFVYRRIKQVDVENTNLTTRSISRDIIEQRPIYYVLLPGATKYESFKSINKHSLINLFAGRKSEIRKLLRQNHLNIKTEKDFVMGLRIVLSYNN